MSQILTLELNDQAFAAIQQQAQTIGIPPATLIATLLEQKFSPLVKRPLTDADTISARAKFERHFGTLAPTLAVDLDNESIDADLAAEYASTHE
jgi:hypothetical protein